MNLKRITLVVFVTSAALFTNACSSQLERADATDAPVASLKNDVGLPATPVVDMKATQNLHDLLPKIANKRVIYVGERHDTYSHHLNQLAVIRALHQRNPEIAIGMEFFQQPFQPVLDDYIAGVIDEKTMLRRTEWYKRWRFDFRLYRPILQYAREHRIPVIALNVAKEITSRVSEVGIEGLKPEERRQIPARLDDSSKAYRERIRAVYRHHPKSDDGGFDRFLQVQLAWDEGMAERTVRYLQQYPHRQMVILAGSGHLMYGTGIPNRVSRRQALEGAILLPADKLPIEPGIADYLLYPEPATLPPAGLMGVMLEDHDRGVRISGVVPKSAAAEAGLQKGDIIQGLDGARVKEFADIKIGMLGKVPGEQIELKLLRPRIVLEDRLMEITLKLGK